MEPYVKPKRKGKGKFKIFRFKGMPGTGKGVSKQDKLVTKNANRSLKKAVRQEVTMSIKEALENL